MTDQANGTVGMEEDVRVETVERGALVLTAQERAALDAQVATAKQFPRIVSKSLNEALSLATRSQAVATSCFYVLPRGKKDIEGPSARLAEIMAYSWGNMRIDSRITAEGETHVTAVGTCLDLEKNVGVRVEVKRRITDSKGVRYNDDMIGVTSMAAISIALRNAVFKTIPAAFTQEIYEAARQASVGDAKTMEQNRRDAIVWFRKVGITEENLFRLLGVEGANDIDVEEHITLRGIMTALKEGDTTVDQLLKSLQDDEGDTEQMSQRTKKKGKELKDKLAEIQREKATKANGNGGEKKGEPAPETPEEADAKARQEDLGLANEK